MGAIGTYLLLPYILDRLAFLERDNGKLKPKACKSRVYFKQLNSFVTFSYFSAIPLTKVRVFEFVSVYSIRHRTIALIFSTKLCAELPWRHPRNFF